MNQLNEPEINDEDELQDKLFSEETVKRLYAIAGNDAVKLSKWFKKIKQEMSPELIETIVHGEKPKDGIPS